jgi:hypothetical protein
MDCRLVVGRLCDNGPMFPVFPNMTALVFFGIPSLTLIFVAKAVLHSGDAIRILALGTTLAAALLGTIGMLPV